MRITALVNGIEREASWMEGEKPGYQCLPAGSNKIETAKVFADLETAGKFLRENPSWGIRMRPVVKIGNPPANKITKNVLIDGRPR